jgi:hypothetical protein
MSDDDERQELPTKDQPLHGRRRPVIGPVLLTVAILGLVVLLYLAGLAFLVD